MKRVALVSCLDIQGLDIEDSPLPAALRTLNVETEVVAWDDAAVEWSRFDAAVIRSTWNYFQRTSEFLAWLAGVETETRLFNSGRIVRANIHKGYLLDLASRGIPIVPTELVRQGDRRPIAEVAAQRGWTDVVLKPAVSVGGNRTLRHADVGSKAAQEHARALLTNGDALLQPYQPSVLTRRERSLVFFDGSFSHAVEKVSVFDPRAPPPDFRIAGAVRSEVHPVDGSTEEIELATAAVKSASVESLLYARVDLVRGEDDTLRLMELELIEPSLFLTIHAPAAARLAEAIARRLS